MVESKKWHKEATTRNLKIGDGKMLEAKGVVSATQKVTLELTKDEVQTLLLLARMRQDDIKKVRGDFPMRYQAVYAPLDVKLEQLKMKIVGQL